MNLEERRTPGRVCEALYEEMARVAVDAIARSVPPTPTHCPYCALQCGMTLAGAREQIEVRGNDRFPVNRGALCIKGWTAAELLNHPARLQTPLARDAAGVLRPVSWEEALARVARGLVDAQAHGGRDAAGVFGSGSLTNEKAYLLGKFARIALGSAQIDYNGRFCMSSAAAAALRALGIDRGLPFPLADIADSEAVLLAGSNVAETMPPLMQYFQAQRAAGGQLIVADPRRTATAAAATLHLRLTPGSDAALANGLLHVLVRDGLLDRAYIDRRTEGFAAARAVAAAYWPGRVERITGVPEQQVVRAAHLLGTAKSAMVLSGRGAEQQAQGVNNTLALINIALALGLPGRRFSGYGCLTGQGNGQGGREHGQKADQLPGYRRLDDPVARRQLAAVWDVPEATLPQPGRSAYELLDSLGQEGGVRALLVIGSNPAVSAPNARQILRRLRALDFLAVADFFLSETAALADVVLPVAQWAEEDGTTTNLEGRVVLRRRAFVPPDGVRTDIELICGVAAALGRATGFSFESSEDVFNELRRASAGGAADYAGISYARIEAGDGIYWPCPDVEHPGQPRLFVDRFPTANGRARFHAVEHQSPAEERDDDFPLYLTTGRVLAHYQTGSQTHRVSRLEDLAPEPLAEAHPRTAKRLGLRDGDRVRLTTRRGRAEFRLRTTAAIREDTIFVPFHWGGQGSANRLTNPALDPVSRMPEFKVCAARLEPAAEGATTDYDS